MIWTQDLMRRYDTYGAAKNLYFLLSLCVWVTERTTQEMFIKGIGCI